MKTYTAVEVAEIENTAYVNGVDVGLLQERERIITLLEALENDERNRGGDWIEMPITEVVALINGTVANNATTEPVANNATVGREQVSECHELCPSRMGYECICFEMRAQAWEEGFDASEKDYATHELTGDWDNDCTPNPYREGTD